MSSDHNIKHFGKALICANGHVISSYLELQPAFQTKKCVDCGADTIDSCLICHASIRGKVYSKIEQCVSSNQFTGRKTYDKRTIITKIPYRIPSYCHECGNPYPWTKASLEAGKKLILEMDELTNEEKGNFSNGLPAILSDTPSSPVAITRIKKYLSKVKPALSDGFKQIFFGLATEAAKKAIW